MVGLRGAYGHLSRNGRPEWQGLRAGATRTWSRTSLCRRGEEEGASHFGDINPAVSVLARANPDGRAGFRHAVPHNVKLGDVAPAVGRGRQQPQEGEVLDAADASPDGPGALHQRVLGRRARERSFSVILPPVLVTTNSASLQGSRSLAHCFVGGYFDQHRFDFRVNCSLHRRIVNARLLTGQLGNDDDQQGHHHYADHRPKPHPSARPFIHPSIRLYDSS